MEDAADVSPPQAIVDSIVGRKRHRDDFVDFRAAAKATLSEVADQNEVLQVSFAVARSDVTFDEHSLAV